MGNTRLPWATLRIRDFPSAHADSFPTKTPTAPSRAGAAWSHLTPGAKPMTAIPTDVAPRTADVDQLAFEHDLSHDHADNLLELAFHHIVTGSVTRKHLVDAISAARSPRRTTSRNVAAVLRTCSDLLGRTIS